MLNRLKSILSQIRFRLSQKQLIILSLIIGLLILAVFIYRLTSLWLPEQSLITLLPDAPICSISIKNLEGFVETFQRSEFGKQTAQMPLLGEIQRTLWWRQMLYQKQVWEYEMGGKLDLKKINGYLGEEAILSLYERGGEPELLLISAVGAKEKLEIATLIATDAVNSNYKRLKERYRGLNINTITGYPREFSYAFIGQIGLLSTDRSLIQETIDIYTNQKRGFTALQPQGGYLREQYNANQSTCYIDAAQLTHTFAFSKPIQSILEGVQTWTFSNRYEKGVIYSQHRLVGKANWQRRASPQPVDRDLLSMLPATTAFLGMSRGVNPSAVWKPVHKNLPLQYRGSVIDLSPHFASGVGLALLASPGDAPAIIPSVLLICSITDRSGLEAELTKLKRERITVNGTPLQFLDPQDYQGVELQPVQLRFGFLLSMKGGYALINNYWIIGTTLNGLTSAIDAFTDRELALADAALPSQLEDPGEDHLLIQPNRFIPELKRFIPIAGLMASASGGKVDANLIKRITDNLFPLEALGTIAARTDFNRNMMDATVQIVLEK